MDTVNRVVKRLPRVAKGIVKGTNELSDSEAKGLFLGWLNNRMGMILMAIQCIKAKEQSTLAHFEFFLHDLEHHFLAGDRSLSEAFRYLRRYFRVYPNVTLAQSRKALEKVKEIYNAFGLELEISGLSPKLSREERMKRQIREYLQEILAASPRMEKQLAGFAQDREVSRPGEGAVLVAVRQRIRAAIFYLLYALKMAPKMPEGEREEMSRFAVEIDRP